jgi:hypothetical protein
MSDSRTTSAATEDGALAQNDDAPPPFDPDPALVADLEGNRFALRAFRKGAEAAHDAAEAERAMSRG